MRKRALSRRTVIEAGACTLIAAAAFPQMARASAEPGVRPKSRETIRNYYAAWQTKDWRQVNVLLADDFAFSSPLDDRISKSDFKAGCWDAQIAYIDRFELKQIIGSDNEAFVLYVCHTANGKTFRNVEYFRLLEGKVKTIECYFGGKSSFPSAVSTGQG